MMNYEMFKGVIKTEFINYLGDEYKNLKVDIHPCYKVNEKKDGIVLIDGDESIAFGMSPTLYIDNLYKMYSENEDLKGVMTFAADLMKTSLEKNDKIQPMLQSLDDVMDKVVLQLINTEQNKELLADSPHKDFCDLSVIYRVVFAEEQEGIYSAIVTNKMVEALGINPDDLFKHAVENTKRINPVVICTMNDVMGKMFADEDMPEDVMNFMINDIPPENMMYIMSNKRGINGAVSMIYQDELHSLAEKLKDDLLILPSSVHEVIVVTATGKDPKELADMVYTINMAQVLPQDRLSNQVYHYDKLTRKLTVAADIPNRALIEDVAEQKQEYKVSGPKL